MGFEDAKHLTRRQFLRRSTATAAGVAASGINRRLFGSIQDYFPTYLRDSLHNEEKMTIGGIEAKMIEGVPVLGLNGEFQTTDDLLKFWNQDELERPLKYPKAWSNIRHEFLVADDVYKYYEEQGEGHFIRWLKRHYARANEIYAPTGIKLILDTVKVVSKNIRDIEKPPTRME